MGIALQLPPPPVGGCGESLSMKRLAGHVVRHETEGFGGIRRSAKKGPDQRFVCEQVAGRIDVLARSHAQEDVARRVLVPGLRDRRRHENLVLAGSKFLDVRGQNPLKRPELCPG